MKRPMLEADQPNPMSYLRDAPAIDRLMYRTTERDSGCWEWRGYRTPQGYGIMGTGGDRGAVVGVHRVSYEHYHGPIPDGLQIDHLCRNRACVNPDHLEAVTFYENQRRGWVARDNGCCPNGHERTPDSTSYDRSGGRFCRVCDQARKRAYKQRIKAAA